MKRSDNIRTTFVLKKAIQYMKPTKDDMVLQIGLADDGVLLDLVHDRVKEFHGVESNERQARRIGRRYRALPNVLIQHASLTNLPYPQHYFEKIFFPEFTAQVSSELELRRILDELFRVSSPDAVIFVGGVLMFKEPASGLQAALKEWVASWLKAWEARHAGWMNAHPRVRDLMKRSIPSANVGPMFSEEEFLSLCREYGLSGGTTRIELTHALSLGRTDFLLCPIPETDEEIRKSPLSESDDSSVEHS